MDQTKQKILMGNEAIGRGVVEAGCTLTASYPGTPASEILASVVNFSRETEIKMHIEWSVNEKVAYEVALANSYTGKRSAVAMKQVGLNVASDPFMRSAYLGVKGGFVVIVADDPGPHSSQTEQDSRLFALSAKIPVFDPASPREAKEMVRKAFELSEKYEIPVMLRSTTRICHARQNVPCLPPERLERTADFEKDPGRWVATPQFLYDLHHRLNDKIDKILEEEDFSPLLIPGDGSLSKYCIISSGVAFAHTCDLLEDMKFSGKIDLFQVTMPYPLNKKFIRKINSGYKKILVIEETYPVIEMQLTNPEINGRNSKLIPNQGELTPDIIQDVLKKFLELPLEAGASPEQIKGKRPTLCPGCPHRAAFYAIKETFPEGIFPSDIGCYTLGMNLGAVDTCHCMGACISQGAGFYHAYAQDNGKFPTIAVTIGDSTFFHAGIPGLINAVFQKARFIVVILDNSTTAMTGNQPTPEVGIMADGTRGTPVLIPDLVKACGVRFLKECDPYDLETFTSYLKEADQYCRSEDGGVAVIISKHPCVLDKEAMKAQPVYSMRITEDCTGCEYCLNNFECPALVSDSDGERVIIDQNICIGCGVCQHVCPVGAIIVEGGGKK
ncbi:MAG: indolepyruvate ferredoxin oxidoreductase subunit alpha [Desulfobacteraceae bacterium 4484_190.3]|nr:MAG: indolepyruvate ferredoxin oxidoreductase subunit alpha [Desulfobacteraceae bacterium 4484_190.3]